tara:strand:- start:2499 stop:2684 length:186 start_codon:yes stop_codon:yes gene_type:complete
MKEFTLAKISFFCLLLQATIANVTLNESIDFIGDHISIISFIIIVIANWGKVKAQVKKWIK